MMLHLSRPNFLGQQGQAMTEFVVSVSYVFLGLFVLVPMFGKLMDMQFQTMQASRYVAWERTVWFDQNEASDESVQSSNYWESVATRDDDAVMNSMQNRIFYGTGPGVLKPLTEDDVDGAVGNINPIWTFVQSTDGQNKKTMYQGTALEFGTDVRTDRKTSLDAQDTPSVVYDIIDVMADTISTIKDPVDSLLDFIGVDNDDFLEFAYGNNVNNERTSYYSPVIYTQVFKTNSKGGGNGVWDTDKDGNWGSGIEDALFQNWDGKLEARSAILADGWNTQSLSHYQQRADDFVPSTLFDNKLFNTVIDIASYLDGAIGNLEFGAVGIEPMPGSGGEPADVSCDNGFCAFEE